VGLDNILDLLFVEGLNSIDGREKIEILGLEKSLDSELKILKIVIRDRYQLR